MRPTDWPFLVALTCICSTSTQALEVDRLRVQRKEVFDFAEKPSLSQNGDRITIRFKAKDFCDATVAIVHQSGKILRHLASGVLGANAPAPFQKKALKQEIVWDGKDEIGRYVDNKDECHVRVSLGLKPRMEQTLFWSPKKLMSGGCPRIRATPEGVYVFYGGHNEQLRLFDHDGNYIRTVYPFPSEKMGSSPENTKVKGLKWITYPPDKGPLPSKLNGHDQDTFLQGSVSEFVVRGKRVYLAGSRLARLATDGSSGGLPLNGPETGIPANNPDKGKISALPGGAAISPDGRALYLTGYLYGWSRHGHAHVSWYHGVYKLDPTSDAKPTVFAGKMEKDKAGRGSDDKKLNMPTDVACDGKGRVYVADHRNDRIQVFNPSGRLLKSIKTFRPTMLRIHPKNGEIWVFSWPRLEYYYYDTKWNWVKGKTRPTLTRMGPLNDPKVRAKWELPVEPNFGRGAYAEIDFHAENPTVWLANDGGRKISYTRTNIRLLRPEGSGGKLMMIRDFNKEAHAAMLRPRPVRHGRQRVFVDPVTGRIYVGEHTTPTQVACKSFHQMPVIRPKTGKIKMVNLPTDAEDMGFDWEGRAYLRCFNGISRFDPRTWREVPFDYGEERKVYHGQGGGGEKPHLAISAIRLPSVIGGMFHLGGMGVSAQGHVVVSCINPNAGGGANRKKAKGMQGRVAYRARLYPGRHPGWETHIFDIHGKLMKDDVFPGLNHTTMVKIDRENNVFALAAGAPYLDGKCYFNGRGCTLIKGTPGKVKLLSGKATIPLSAETRPKRPYDLARPGLWAQGAEWLFGPVGAEGHYGSGGKCSCYVNGNFDLDYYGRSFAPEVDRFRVVVLDTNGNVMTRIGRYGNVDDGMPVVKPAPKLAGKQGGQPLKPHSIGGDEVAIMHVQNLAVHSDHRLVLADVGNQCIRSVKLDYHTTERLPLVAKEVNSKPK